MITFSKVVQVLLQFAFLCILRLRKFDEWLAFLPLRSERLFSDELGGMLPAAEGLMVM